MDKTDFTTALKEDIGRLRRGEFDGFLEAAGCATKLRAEYLDALDEYDRWVPSLLALDKEMAVGRKRASDDLQSKYLAQVTLESSTRALADAWGNEADQLARSRIPDFDARYGGTAVQEKQEAIFEGTLWHFIANEEAAHEVMVEVVATYTALASHLDVPPTEYWKEESVRQRVTAMYSLLDPGRVLHKLVLEGRLRAMGLRNLHHILFGGGFESLSLDDRALLLDISSMHPCAKCLEPMPVMASVCKTCRNSVDDPAAAQHAYQAKIEAVTEGLRARVLKIWEAMKHKTTPESEEWTIYFAKVKTAAASKAAEIAAKRQARAAAERAAAEAVAQARRDRFIEAIGARGCVLVHLTVTNRSLILDKFQITGPSGSYDINDDDTFGRDVGSGVDLEISKDSSISLRIAVSVNDPRLRLIAKTKGGSQKAQPIVIDASDGGGDVKVDYGTEWIEIDDGSEVVRQLAVTGACSGLAVKLGRPEWVSVIRVFVTVSAVFGLGFLIWLPLYMWLGPDPTSTPFAVRARVRRKDQSASAAAG